VTEAPRPRRWLVIGATYPPLHMGGYELMCRDHVASMRGIGVEPVVLTSTFGLSGGRPREERGTSGEMVVRALDWEVHEFAVRYPSRGRLWRREWQQQRILRRILEQHRPEVAIIWMLLGLSKSLMITLHEMGIPIIVVVHEGWPIHDFDGDPWTSFWGRRSVRCRSRVVKRLVRGVVQRVVAPWDLWPAVRAAVPVYCSDSLRSEVEAGRPEWRDRGVVVHDGIDVERMSRSRDDRAPLGHPLRLLYAGRVESRKGVHTAISVLAGVRRAGITARLRIVGWRNEAYVATLRSQAEALGVDSLLDWTDALPHEAIPAVYAEADMLLFPTIWAEPFGLAPLEAMATGCVVLATGSGGSGEYLRDGENAMLFPVNGADAAVRTVLQLVESPELVARLRAGGRATVSRHSMQQTAQSYNAVVEKVITSQRVKDRGWP
jgi:glycosyltransferase involved in cell wall biosynthesis